MEILVVSFVALIAAALTLFSGFGLGTVLTPAFALFFPVATAVAMTAVVHLANNLFKIGLVGRDAHWPTVVRFGIPAALASLIGASLLASASSMAPWLVYEVGGRIHAITPVKSCIGIVITVFALLELSPAFARLAFPARWLLLGGCLSGFFGGLSGNQGALRSAFLIKVGLTKESYIGTSTACAVLVDIVRLGVYGVAFSDVWIGEAADRQVPLVLGASLAAFTGSYFGKRLLKQVTLRFVELAVAGLMVGIGLGLATGLL